MGNVTNGALAEYVPAKASNLYLMPDGVTPEVGASFYISYFTALYALQGRAWLKSGERLLVLGAAGGTGIAAIQIGKLTTNRFRWKGPQGNFDPVRMRRSSAHHTRDP